MACVSPPELENRELLAYLDGEGGREVVEHLQRCPHCRERAQQLAQFQDYMIVRMYRAECPSSTELGEHYLGVLPGERTEAIALHLAECPLCKHEVDQLRTYLADLEPGLETSPFEQVKEHAKILIARLVDGLEGGQVSEKPGRILAFAGLRGEEGACVYEVGNIQIAIEVQDDTERPGRKAILGLVIGAEPAGMRAHLWQEERCIVTVPVDELGNFVIPGLVSGIYELILGGPEVEVYIQELQVAGK